MVKHLDSNVIIALLLAKTKNRQYSVFSLFTLLDMIVCQHVKVPTLRCTDILIKLPKFYAWKFKCLKFMILFMEVEMYHLLPAVQSDLGRHCMCS